MVSPTEQAASSASLSWVGQPVEMAAAVREGAEFMKSWGMLFLAALSVTARPVAAQTDAVAPKLFHLAASSARVDDYPTVVPAAQFTAMPAMPGMPGMGNMQAIPGAPPETGGGMGGMAMMMTGEGILEMMAGACTAGLLVGALGATAASAPLTVTGVGAPLSAAAVLSSAGVGCGIATVATLAGVGGMMAWRAGYETLR
jgi:hypothetical protein